MAKPNQQPHIDSLMADMYFGTPMELDNNSGEYNVQAQAVVQDQQVVNTAENQTTTGLE